VVSFVILEQRASNEPSVAEGSVTDLPNAYRRWRSRRLGRTTDALEERLILDLLNPADGRRVLDVGCGDGALATALSRRGARVTGLDADPRMLTAARDRALAESVEVDLVNGQAEALPFPDGAFDDVVAVTVLCFVQRADHAIAEMARVLRPGGRLVIGELSRWSFWAAIRRIRGWLGASTWKAARFHTAGELRSLLEPHGLIVREARGAIYYPPSGFAASLVAHFEPWLGRRTTVGAAFVALSAIKPTLSTNNGNR
jgi:ubiquinone/menaquinone biosynthesis C-methylase UbiE